MTEPFTRHLAPLPASYRMDELTVLSRQHFPATLDVNRAEGQLAIYLPDPQPDQAALDAWRAAVAAHVPSATPTASQNEAAIRDALVNALGTMRTVRDQAAVLKTTVFANNTQRDNAIRDCAQGIELLATNLIRLGRLVAGALEGTT